MKSLLALTVFVMCGLLAIGFYAGQIDAKTDCIIERLAKP